MKTTKLGLAIFAIIIAGATVISSCKKKTTTPDPTPAAADTDQSGASANNTAESVSSDVLHMGSEACDMGASGGNLSSYRAENTSILSCAVVTRDTVNKLVTVTFSGGTCLDGKVRTGSLIYNYSASPAGAKRYRDPGFTMSVSSNNYVVDGNTVTINNKTVTNTTPVGFNPLTTNETWSVSANISVGLSGGGTVSWTCNRVKTLLNTATTYSNSTTPITWSLAKVGIMGTASGTRSNGETFSVNITNQLIRDFGSCTISGKHPFIQGTLVYSPSGKSARTFDYGTGTCDLNATVTIDGVTYPFTLP